MTQRLSDAIDRLAAAVPNGELMAATDPVALLDEAVRLIDAAEQRGYERGLREGREMGRADVGKYSGAIGLIDVALGCTDARPLRETVDAVKRLVAERDALRADHVTTPQGDATSRSQARRIAAQRGETKCAEARICATCGGSLTWDSGAGAHYPVLRCAACEPEGAAPKLCMTCHGHGRRVYAVIEGESESETCPDCAGESGGER